MAPFFPVYIRRSDGKTSNTKSPSSKEPNEPLTEQLDTTPNQHGICDYYRECLPGESKEVDWRRKLAGMLVREIGGAEQKDRNFILAALPENYRLFEHVRFKVSEGDGKNQKASKNHAAGSNERQDAYLYGHPQGRKKRYRSPAEFFPHLLWLSTDDQGDPNNCSCKFCSPEELESDDKPKLPAKEAKQPVAKPDPQSTSTGVAAGPAGAQRRPPPQTAPADLPSPMPRFRRNEQRLDAQYNQFLYRPGELVWFQRSSAWGLGVVVQRDVNHSNPRVHQYRVQPLSHPLSHPKPLVCTQIQIRAWLSWSPPPCICPALNANTGNNTKAHTYDTVDWQAYLNGRYGPGDAEVDGSILAAKYVETTYTLFDIVDSKTSTKESGQTSEIHYNGMFLGAEKFWLGDPLRIRNSTNLNDMMVLHAIMERQSPLDASRAQITLIGDVYSQHSAQPDSGDVPKSDENLPPRIREELAARNEITSHTVDPSRRLTYFWKLESKSAKFSLADIKGRWYESSLLMPIVARGEYEADRQKGELGDVGMWMNGHGDCNKPFNAEASTSKPADLKLKRREDAFARAVPPTFKISKGLDDPKANSSASSSTQATTNINVERPSHTPQPLPRTQQPGSLAPQTAQAPQQQQHAKDTLQQQQAAPQPTKEPPSEEQRQQQGPARVASFDTFMANPQTAQHPVLNFDPNASKSQPEPNQFNDDDVDELQTAQDGQFDHYMDFTDTNDDGAAQQDLNAFGAYGSQQYNEQGFDHGFYQG